MKRVIILIIVVLMIPCASFSGEGQQYQLVEFGAFYTRIQSGKNFEKYARVREHSDIVVDLGQGSIKFIFWRGSSYLPYLETRAGRFYVEEIIPRSGDGSEEMPDRTNAYSTVRIIESSDSLVDTLANLRYFAMFSTTG